MSSRVLLRRRLRGRLGLVKAWIRRHWRGVTLAALLGIVASGFTIASAYSSIAKDNAERDRIAAAEASASAAASADAAAKSPAALAEKHDRTNPQVSCKNDAVVKATFPMVKPGETDAFATARVLHSPTCTTSWVHVVDFLEGATVYKYIERLEAEGIPGNHDATSGDVTIDIKAKPENTNSFSMQLYAPGCVLVRIEITDASGEQLGKVPLREVC